MGLNSAGKRKGTSQPVLGQFCPSRVQPKIMKLVNICLACSSSTFHRYLASSQTLSKKKDTVIHVTYAQDRRNAPLPILNAPSKQAVLCTQVWRTTIRTSQAAGHGFSSQCHQHAIIKLRLDSLIVKSRHTYHIHLYCTHI